MAKILIIDDDPDIVEAMKIVLEGNNYSVIIAKNGKDGLKKANEERPDLVILDVMMETSDAGFEAAREIKRVNNDIPILMLTAIKEKTGFGFEKEAGDKTWLPVDEYLDKPLKPKDLISKVEFFLKRK